MESKTKNRKTREQIDRLAIRALKGLGLVVNERTVTALKLGWFKAVYNVQLADGRGRVSNGRRARDFSWDEPLFLLFRKNRTYQIRAAYFISASLIVIVTNNLLRLIGGDGALGVFAIISTLYAALNMPQTGITQGMQTIVGYNFGQKRFHRVRDTIRLSLGATVVYGLLICGLSLLFPAVLIALLSKESAMITEGQNALRLLSLSCPVSGVAIMVAAIFQSVGKAREAMMITQGGLLLVKLPVLLLASRLFAWNGIWVSETISDLILCVAALFMLKSYQQRLIAMEPPAYSS